MHYLLRDFAQVLLDETRCALHLWTTFRFCFFFLHHVLPHLESPRFLRDTWVPRTLFGSSTLCLACRIVSAGPSYICTMYGHRVVVANRALSWGALQDMTCAVFVSRAPLLCCRDGLGDVHAGLPFCFLTSSAVIILACLLLLASTRTKRRHITLAPAPTACGLVPRAWPARCFKACPGRAKFDRDLFTREAEF